jgi:SAM-dependent methyltransferase
MTARRDVPRAGVVDEQRKEDAMDRATERARALWDEQAAWFDWGMRFWDALLLGEGRRWACSQACGDVLEIAVGTGRNLPFYPAGTRLTGIELSPKMLERAHQRLAAQGRGADLRLADAQALDFPDASFDTVVCTQALCSIPDDRRAVAEVKRVLRPGGRFVLLEHVRSPIAAIRLGQRLFEPVFRAGGDTLLREPLEHLEAEGFEIEHLERSRLGIVERAVARKPA